MAYETVSVRMSRSDPQIPWGFSLRQHGAAVVIGRIDRESLSDKAGLREGDEVESVCGQNARGMSASQAASIADNARFEVTFNMKRLVSGHQCLPWTLTEKDNKVVVDEIRPGFGSGFAHGQYPPAGGQRSSSYSTNEQRSSRTSTNWDGAIGRDIRQQDAFQNSQFGRNIGSQGQLMAAPPSGGMHSPGSYQRHESSSYSKTHSTSGTGQEPKNESYSTHSESHFSSDGQNQTQSHLSGSSGAPFGSHSLGHGGGGSSAPFSAPRAISSVPYGSSGVTQSSNQFKSSSTTSGAPFGGSKFGSNTASYDNRQSSGFGGHNVGAGYGGANTGSGVGARGGSYGGADGGAGYGHGGAGTGSYGGSNGGAGGYGHGGAGGQGYGAGGHHPAQNYSYNNGATTASYGKNGTGGVPLNKATYINTAPSDFGKTSAQSPGSKVFYHSPSPRTRRELSPHASVQHLQYNSPMNLYSSESVAEQFEQQTGRKVDGVPHNAPAYLNSETRKLIEEQEHGRGMRGHSPATQSSSFKRISSAVGAPVQ